MLTLSGLARGSWFVLPEEPAGVSREERILLPAGQGRGVRHEGACGSRGTGTRGPREKSRGELLVWPGIHPPPLAGVSSAPVPLWGARGPSLCLRPVGPAPGCRLCRLRCSLPAENPARSSSLGLSAPSLQPPAVTPGRGPGGGAPSPRGV